MTEPSRKNGMTSSNGAENAIKWIKDTWKKFLVGSITTWMNQLVVFFGKSMEQNHSKPLGRKFLTWFMEKVLACLFIIFSSDHQFCSWCI